MDSAGGAPYPGTVRRSSSPARAALLGTLPVLTYLGFALLLVRGVWAHPSSWILGLPPDSIQQVWFLDWVGRSPDPLVPRLVTTWLTAPHPVNLMWNTASVLLGVVLAPLTRTLGPILSYNLAIGLAPVLAATSMDLVLRRLKLGRAAAWAGGWLFGFAPLTVAEMNAGHLPWASLGLVPLLLLLLVQLVRRRGNPIGLGVAAGAVAAAQLLLNLELLVDCVLVALLTLGVLAVAYPRRLAGGWGYRLRAAAAALATGGVLSLRALIVLFGSPGRLAGDTIVRAPREGTDLLAYVVPGPLQLLSSPATDRLARHLYDYSVYRSSYLGVGVVVLVGWGLGRRRQDPLAFTAAVVLLLCLGLALGASPHAGGRAVGGAGPWTLIAQIPLLRDSIPSRLGILADAAAAVLLACAAHRLLARHRLGPGGGRGGAAPAALLMVVLLPLIPAAPVAVNPAHPPQFFSSPMVATIPPGTIALVLPAGAAGGAVSLLWQVQARFRYRMAWSYVLQAGPHHTVATGPAPSPLVTVVQRLEAGGRARLNPGERRRLRRQLAHGRIGAVILGPLPHRGRLLRFWSELLGPPALRRGGVALWHGPAWSRPLGISP